MLPEAWSRFIPSAQAARSGWWQSPLLVMLFAFSPPFIKPVIKKIEEFSSNLGIF